MRRQEEFVSEQVRETILSPVKQRMTGIAVDLTSIAKKKNQRVASKVVWSPTLLNK